jgi:hypothetical protein
VIYVMVTHATARGEGSSIGGEDDPDLRLRTCITTYKKDCWNDDHIRLSQTTRVAIPLKINRETGTEAQYSLTSTKSPSIVWRHMQDTLTRFVGSEISS